MIAGREELHFIISVNIQGAMEIKFLLILKTKIGTMMLSEPVKLVMFSKSKKVCAKESERLQSPVAYMHIYSYETVSRMKHG